MRAMNYAVEVDQKDEKMSQRLLTEKGFKVNWANIAVSFCEYYHIKPDGLEPTQVIHLRSSGFTYAVCIIKMLNSQE